MAGHLAIEREGDYAIVAINDGWIQAVPPYGGNMRIGAVIYKDTPDAKLSLGVSEN